METYGEARSEVVRDQVKRILSLDTDGNGFPQVGVRDPVVGKLQEGYPGLRPVLFYSPYEAAAWAIIGNRIQIVQAAKIKSISPYPGQNAPVIATSWRVQLELKDADDPRLRQFVDQFRISELAPLSGNRCIGGVGKPEA